MLPPLCSWSQLDHNLPNPQELGHLSLNNYFRLVLNLNPKHISVVFPLKINPLCKNENLRPYKATSVPRFQTDIWSHVLVRWSTRKSSAAPFSFFQSSTLRCLRASLAVLVSLPLCIYWSQVLHGFYPLSLSFHVYLKPTLFAAVPLRYLQTGCSHFICLCFWSLLCFLSWIQWLVGDYWNGCK